MYEFRLYLGSVFASPRRTKRDSNELENNRIRRRSYLPQPKWPKIEKPALSGLLRNCSGEGF
jgi:hypothetical protein